ncbi:NAD(P)/FAD-dependent oxidoreductase [Ottowia thiooxydans]|uniref:NAD(P)/FAD-dependent oxidoreductase n=1 Tax=Ottowia thiooxydans TaxID=219182 RepID=UPI00048EA2C2|nr:FAD-dependent oxidoreductase [Ottowia thiooxydans]
MTEDTIVIVGGGHAAAALCSALATAGCGQRVHVISAEAHLPYHRPPLSKSFIKDLAEVPQLHRDAAWYASQGITVHASDAVVSIDRAAKRLKLSSEKDLSYGTLVLATGTRARTLPNLALPSGNVATLRTATDAERFRGWIHETASGNLVVLGGGFIGLEVAGTARQLGWSVRVLEAAPRLLARSTSPQLSEYILQHHRNLGTEVTLGAKVGEFAFEAGNLKSLHVNDDEWLVQHLLLSVGAVPEVDLAHGAGLEVENGIRVDGAMRTSDPDILAIGDCTCFEYRGRLTRLESVQNANDQAKVAAATLTGQVASYQPTPFFWSDQGGLRLQMVGLWRDGLHTVTRPGSAPSSFSLFHFEGDALVAVESANAPMDHMWSRKLLEAGRSPSPAQVQDPQLALKTLL